MSRLLFLFFAVSLGLAQTASAGLITFDVSLDPGQEVPAPTLNGSAPFGTATVVVDTNTGDTNIAGSYFDMTSDVVGAHLHGLAGPGATAGVIFGLSPTGGTAGTLSGSSILGAADLFGLLTGQTYINVHTVNNGPGEIRGQVIPAQVPEPATLFLMGLGLAGLGFARSRSNA